MKTKIFSIIVFMILILTSPLFPSDMIATIKQPVTTEFGTYNPYPVEITPNCKTYTVDENFENVINFNHFTFTEAEKTLLTQNHFVVSKRSTNNNTGYREIFDIYNECRDKNIPIFVTTDAMLHTFHHCFDYFLMTIEQNRFFNDLNVLLEELIVRTFQQYNSAKTKTALEALVRNLDFLITAKLLLDDTFTPPEYESKYEQELALINACKDFLESPVFGYLEDYSQYQPRGHYTKTPELQSYFRAMMWLGRMTFAVVPVNGVEISHANTTLSAILLIQAMKTSRCNCIPAEETWRAIYDPTVFFVGRTDDLNIYQYFPIIKQIYGMDFFTLEADSLADESLLNAFLTETEQLPGPKISYPFQPKGYRFMGQRFIPDSYIFTELSDPKVQSRYFPKGLDAMVVLGSNKAKDILRDLGEMDSYPFYEMKLDNLCNEFKSYDDSIWAQNIYWNWLYSLMPLLFPKGEGYPAFMQKPAWLDKELYAALSSWAELRHDTILYAKQSGAWTGVTPMAAMQQGFVEPNPFLYGRLAALADYLITGLQKYNLLFEEFSAHLDLLQDVLLRLKSISEKELTNTPLNSYDYMYINGIGATIEEIVEFDSEYDNMGPSFDSDYDMPVIADVHTVGGTGETLCLEEGVGYPFSIYVICNVENQLKITKGACFSYYEFVHSANPRLTDEAWRDMLKGSEPPELPTWTESFLDRDDSWINNNPYFYFWGTFGTFSISVVINPDTIHIGDIAELSIDPFSRFHSFSLTKVVVTTADGEKTEITDYDVVEDKYIIEINTTDLVRGLVQLEIFASFYEDGLDYYPIEYRTSFELLNATSVNEDVDKNIAKQFSLKQNYPNPFNASTVIGYSLLNESKVNISIYDMLGKSVNTLVQNKQNSGNYSVQWDGKDYFGNIVPSGVYIYKIKAGNYSATKKMVLMF